MACSCSSNPCSCNYTVDFSDNASVVYSCANINLTGIGVYDSQNANEFDFRGITSANNALIITLDSANNAILLTFNIQQIIDDLPDATTTQRGVLETATDAEALAKVATDKILTPSNLAALGSTTTFSGLIEIATDAEAIAGASALLAITPASLLAVNALLDVTVSFDDAVARAALAPAFVGQYGYQKDTFQPYSGFGLAAGNWRAIPAEGASTTFTTATTWTGVATVLAGSWAYTGATLDITTSSVLFNAASILDMKTASIIRVNGVGVPANSVLNTSGTIGELTSSLIATYISSANTQTGYTTFVNPATLRTCDTTTVTLPQLATIVGTLIEDLKAIQLPAT